jgi:iron complex outermembrane receptor protein
MKKHITYSLFLLSLLTICSAQEATISGTLTNRENLPAEFVQITLRNSNIATITDARGCFTLTQIPAGTHTLLAAPISGEVLEEELTLSANTKIDIQLQLKQKVKNLDEVNICVLRNANETPVSIGKLPIKSMDLPQSIAVVDREILERQQTQYLSDVLRNFNGVYIMGNTGGAQQEIAARGFALGNSNTFKNGVRFNNTILPEMSALEKVEVLKGSAAILYGNVSAGGILNMITKKPNYQKGGELSMRFDSYNFYKPTIDLFGVLDSRGRAAFRLNTAYENAGSFRNDVRSERIYFNPSFASKLGKKTELIIEGDYLKDRRTADFGVGAINYQLIDMPRMSFIGAKWSNYQTEQKSVTATLQHAFNRNWQIRSVSSAQLFTNDLYSTVRPNSNNQFIRPNGNWVRGVQRTAIDDQYFISQLDLSGKFYTGSVRHTLLVGADVDHYSTTTLAYNTLNKYDSINVFDLTKYQQRMDQPDLTKRSNTEVPIQRAGAYVQDLVDFGMLKVLAGLRYSYLETGSRVTTYANNTYSYSSQKDQATTPRLGLVFQPVRNLSIFGSYANSFSPNTGVDRDGKQLSPSYINQAEAGLKSNLLKDKLTANITVYQIINSNLAQTDLSNGNVNTNIKELAGEVTSKGLEADIQSRSFNGFVLLAGYSFNETRYTRSNTYVVGSLLRYNPNHTANASVFYTFEKGKIKGLSFGISSLYFGERMAGRSTRVNVENDPYRLITISAYTLLDLSAAYHYKAFTIRCKISNIANTLSYNVHDDNSVNPIAPRQLATTISFKF